MSFSKDVKEELSLQISDARHCRLAELAAILSFGGSVICQKDKIYLKLLT
jgi:DNA-binding transcriptional regulator WhiA